MLEFVLGIPMALPLKFEGSDTILKPDADLRELIEQGAKADFYSCWTCGSCDFECPVNLATGRLRPQKIVRMANLGLLDELLHAPEIWYCQGCRRCAQICPNLVKPSEIISYIRGVVLEKHIFPLETVRNYRLLFARFQRVRKRAVTNCLHRKSTTISDRKWCEWLLTPVKEERGVVRIKTTEDSSKRRFKGPDLTRAAACFTCGECSSACPISCERSVFDPRYLFRMFILGMVDKLLNSADIWLCLDCGRCTNACSQLVEGRKIICRLKYRAIQKGIIDQNFFKRLEQTNQLIYTRLLDEVDALFGFNAKTARTETGMNNFSVCCSEYEEFICA